MVDRALRRSMLYQAPKAHLVLASVRAALALTERPIHLYAPFFFGVPG